MGLGFGVWGLEFVVCGWCGKQISNIQYPVANMQYAISNMPVAIAHSS
jgi:hypothetical protein